MTQNKVPPVIGGQPTTRYRVITYRETNYVTYLEQISGEEDDVIAAVEMDSNNDDCEDIDERDPKPEELIEWVPKLEKLNEDPS